MSMLFRILSAAAAYALGFYLVREGGVTWFMVIAVCLISLVLIVWDLIDVARRRGLKAGIVAQLFSWILVPAVAILVGAFVVAHNPMLNMNI